MSSIPSQMDPPGVLAGERAVRSASSKSVRRDSVSESSAGLMSSMRISLSLSLVVGEEEADGAGMDRKIEAGRAGRVLTRDWRLEGMGVFLRFGVGLWITGKLVWSLRLGADGRDALLGEGICCGEQGNSWKFGDMLVIESFGDVGV